MADRRRALETALTRALREFPVTNVIGLRQVGKTTLVRQMPGRTYVSLDDLSALAAAQRDPEGFVRGLPRPVTIDELQRVPALLLPIKREVDRRRTAGAFLLTGSARIELGRGARESLAGRGALLRLRPMTWAEAAGRPDHNPVDVLFGCRSAAEAARRFPRAVPFEGSRALAGGLPPALLRHRSARRSRWLEQYRTAYVERDVPPLVRLEEVAAFVRFLALAAARTAQTTNYSALAHAAGVSADTGLRWFGVLEATFLADLLPPFWRNIGKRLVKSPKLHLGDAGLAAHLVGLRSWAEALRHNLAGPRVETLIAQHFLAWAEAASRPTRVFHYRTHARAEVDFVLVRGARLLPIEVKSRATVRQFADVAIEHGAGVFTSSAHFERARVERALASLARDLEAIAARVETAARRRTIDFVVEARYAGQVWELDVPVPPAALDPDGLAALVAAFHAAHERVFSVRDEAAPVEFLAWRARLTVPLDHPRPHPADPAGGAPPRPFAVRPAYFPGCGEVETPFFDGPALAAGDRVAGPAVVAEPTTTVVLPPGAAATLSPHGSYVIDTGARR